MAGKRSSGWTNNQGAKTKAAEARERSRRYVIVAVGMSCPVAQVSNNPSQAGDYSHKRIRHGGDLGKMAVPKSLASDDMLDELIKHQELIAGLQKLLQQSDASVEKSTGLILRVVGDNAKLANKLEQKKQEAARWKKLYEEIIALVEKLKGLAEELMDEKAKLLVKYKSLVEESIAAVKESHEAMKKEIEEVRAQQLMMKVAGE